MNAIHKLELKKAQFLTEYRQLCERYGMIVGMATDKHNDTATFFVIVSEPELIDQAIIEMLINETLDST